MSLRSATLALLSFLILTGGALADSPATVTAAFTPGCEKLLLEKIRDAHQEIKVAMYEFTKKDLAEALIERAKHNVKVSLKIDAHEAEFKYTEELLARMQQAKITIERITMEHGAIMHDKSAVIDGRCVVTGSYNWTKRATEENWENIVVIESPAIAQQYQAEWQRIQSTP